MEIDRLGSRIVARHARHRSVVRFEGTDGTSRNAQLPVDGWLVNGETRLTNPDKLTVPRGGVSIVDSGRLSAGESTSVADGAIVIVESPVVCLVRVDGPGEISVDERMRATLRPSGDVTVGWSRPPDAGVREITLESRDAEGVADALMAAAAVSLPSTDTPDRTWPNSRCAAPSITESDRGTPPSEVDRPDTDVELRLPDSLEFVAGTATLAGYVAADVTVDETATETRLRAGGNEWSLGSDPEAVDRRSSSWLRRVFSLDCHTRAAGPHGSRLSGHDDALAAVDEEAATLYDLPLAERVARYLTASDGVDDALPRWPETLHVEPRVDRLTAATPQLCRLADVRLPRCERVDLPDMVDYTPPSTEAVRGAANQGEMPRERAVPASAGRASTTGWAAPGDPMAAYSATSDSSARRTDDAPLRVRVVECGGEKAGETAEQWRDTLMPSVDLSVDPRPEVSGLREVLRSNADVVHVAGHAADDGVVCRDGSLSRADLPDAVCPSVVVWNACSSEPLAQATVSRGAAASVGTTGPIPRNDARRDGAHYARLLAGGWCAERAARVVRRCHDPLGWVVYGDGAVRLQESSAGVPPLVVVDSDADTVTVDYSAPDSPGHWVTGLLSDSDRLCGREAFDLSDRVLEQVAARVDSPVVRDGDLVEPSSLV